MFFLNTYSILTRYQTLYKTFQNYYYDFRERLNITFSPVDIINIIYTYNELSLVRQNCLQKTLQDYPVTIQNIRTNKRL